MNQKTMKISVYKKCDSAYHGDSVTTIEIIDEGSGEFVEISQPMSDGKIQIESMKELTNIFEVACEMLKTCEKYDED